MDEQQQPAPEMTMLLTAFMGKPLTSREKDGGLYEHTFYPLPELTEEEIRAGNRRLDDLLAQAEEWDESD